MDDLWNMWVESTPERMRLFGNFKSTDVVPKEFPEGMRVLVVDDDFTCLYMLKLMLESCKYKVKICDRPSLALSTLRENKDGFDMVLIALHMYAMNGFTLLRRIRNEMDIPAVVVSADTRPSTITGGKKHGAVDIFFKPVHVEDVEDMWQHVIKKKLKEYVNSRSLEQPNCDKQISDDAENTPMVTDGCDQNNDSSSSRKRRHVWTDPVHEKFVEAVNEIGIDMYAEAVPKRILELMPGRNLTTEIISSHLQKYRSRLKKLGREAQEQDELVDSSVEQNQEANSRGRSVSSDLGPLGEVPPQSLTRLSPEPLGQPPSVNQPALSQSATQGQMCKPVEQVFYHSSIASQHLSSGFQTGSSSSDNLGVEDYCQNADMLFPWLDQHQIHTVVSPFQHADIGQASCPVVQPMNNFQIGASTVPRNRTSMEYRLQLEKLGRESQQQDELFHSSRASLERNAHTNSHHGMSVFPDLAPLGEALQQIFPTLDSELLSQPQATLQPVSPQYSLLGHKSNPSQQVNYLRPSAKCASNVLQQFHHSGETSRNLSSGLQSGMMQHDMHTATVQASCLASDNPVAVRQHVYGGSNNLNHRLIPLSRNLPYGMGQVSDGGLRNFDMGLGTSTGASLDQQQTSNFSSIGRSTCIPTGFPVDDVELPITIPDNCNVGGSMLENFSSIDFIYDLLK